jgi:hypothetical protein
VPVGERHAGSDVDAAYADHHLPQDGLVHDPVPADHDLEPGTNPNSPAGKTLRGHTGHSGDLLLPGTTPCPSGGQQDQGARLTATLRPVSGATAGSGNATFTIRLGQTTLCYTLTVTGLADVTAAHIHRGSTAAVVVPLNTPTTGSSSGCTTVERALLREILQNPGAFYVNVHSTAHPNGQVQGNLIR